MTKVGFATVDWRLVRQVSRIGLLNLGCTIERTIGCTTSKSCCASKQGRSRIARGCPPNDA